MGRGAVQRSRLEAEQREVMSVLEHIGRDKASVLEFFDEARDQVAVIADESVNDVSTLKRAVHTLKGNAMLFGIRHVAALCHALEDRIDETGELPDASGRSQIKERWERLCANLETVLGGGASRKLEIDDAEYEAILRAVLTRVPHEQVAEMIAAWKLEPTSRRLMRVAEQAKGIAARLNKGAIVVDVDDQQLRLDPVSWSSFWSSFIHVVRNAVDHGLEESRDRLAAGKSAEGRRLRLATRIDGEHFVIEVQDDGRGIDWEGVAERAARLGISHQSRAELTEALFADGLSTKPSATEFSGRGVGMGAVRAACEQRGGHIRVASEAGGGTRIEFRFAREHMVPELIFKQVG
jgi:chemotaxis protein histidine kinase CheA